MFYKFSPQDVNDKLMKQNQRMLLRNPTQRYSAGDIYEVEFFFVLKSFTNINFAIYK
jgi:hypothetical protein